MASPIWHDDTTDWKFVVGHGQWNVDGKIFYADLQFAFVGCEQYFFWRVLVEEVNEFADVLNFALLLVSLGPRIF